MPVVWNTASVTHAITQMTLSAVRFVLVLVPAIVGHVIVEHLVGGDSSVRNLAVPVYLAQTQDLAAQDMVPVKITLERLGYVNVMKTGMVLAVM